MNLLLKKGVIFLHYVDQHKAICLIHLCTIFYAFRASRLCGSLLMYLSFDCFILVRVPGLQSNLLQSPFYGPPRRSPQMARPLFPRPMRGLPELTLARVLGPATYP